jgi:hypothetical protein
VSAPTFIKAGVAGSSSGTATSVSLSGAPSAGSLLVAIGGRGAATGPAAPSGFSAATFFNNATNNRSGSLSRKVSAGTETTLSSLNGACWNYLEFGNIASPALDATNTGLWTNSTGPAIPSITPTAGRPAIILIARIKQPATPNPGPETLSGVTGMAGAGVVDTLFAGAGNRYRLTTWYKLVASTSGSYGGGNFAGSTDASEDGAVLIAAIVGPAPALSSLSQAMLIG